jgi:hypothetical protein
VWSLRWRLPKISFLVNRYITPPMLVFNTIVLTLPNLSPKFCQFWLQWQAWPTLLALATVELILIMRVSAIYNSSFLMYVFFGFYCCEVGSMLGMIGFLYRTSANPLVTPSYLPGCYSLGFVPWLYGFWVAPVILESIIVILTLLKALRLMRDPIHGSPTLRLIARDSVVYFLIMFSILTANLFIFKFAPPFVSSLLIGPSSSIACVAVGRMMMNMRSLSLNVNATELDTLGSLAFRARSVHPQSQLDSITVGF